MSGMAAGIDEYRQGIANALLQSPIAIEFIATFARFEFALKRGGFLEGKPRCSAGANWNAFAQQLGRGFFAEMQAAPETGLLFTKPPQRLVVADDETKPEFISPEVVRNAQQLFEAVRLVRNNLFHGEKPGIGGRDRDLIRASMFVLDRAMAACASTPGCEGVPAAFTVAHVDGA